MRTPLGAFLFIAFAILMDTYIFQAVKAVSQSASPKARSIIYIVYWVVAVMAIAGFLLFTLTGHSFLPKMVRTYLFAVIVGFFLAKLVAILSCPPGKAPFALAVHHSLGVARYAPTPRKHSGAVIL
jgi:hypothetical protein